MGGVRDALVTLQLTVISPDVVLQDPEISTLEDGGFKWPIIAVHNAAQLIAELLLPSRLYKCTVGVVIRCTTAARPTGFGWEPTVFG